MTKLKEYTAREFIAAYRPDGLGHIVLDFGNERTDISFSEIICDTCNAEMKQPKNEPEKKVVFVVGTDALCEVCASRYREKDAASSPSSLSLASHSTTERRNQ